MNKLIYGTILVMVYTIGWCHALTFDLLKNNNAKNNPQISTREWYAGMALAGMYAADTPGNYIPMDKRVREAYFAADEMVKKNTGELSKRNTQR